MKKIFLLSLLFLTISLIAGGNTKAQPIEELETQLPACNKIEGADNYEVSSVKIRGRWIPQTLKKKVENIIGIGENYSASRTNRARKEVSKFLTEQVGIDLNQGVVAVKYVAADVCPIFDTEDKKVKVEITIHPYYLQVDLLNVGDNILPIPRANTPTFSVGVPPALLATSPVVGVLNDRNYGTSLGLKTSTNLLDLLPESNRESSEALNLDLDARHSLSQTFYNLDTQLEYNSSNSIAKIRPNVAIGYSNQLSPLGEGEEWQQKVQLEGGIQQRLNQSFIRNYTVGGSVSYLDNNYTPRLSETVRNSDTGLQLYGVADTRPLGDGFVRFGAWADAGFPSDAGSYQRLAVQSAYATEIGSGHNTLGLQIMAGSGYAFGNPPEYGQYFGGSLASNFLYESLQSSRIRSFPSGPILRSFGEQQAGLRGSDGLIVGGNFYWHLNFNVAFPVPGWSKPLIPEELKTILAECLDCPEEKETCLESPCTQNECLVDCTTILDGLIKKAKENFKDNLIAAGVDDKTAEAEVNSVFGQEVEPTLNRLVNKTNLYSVKPMLLFDLAQISGDNGAGSKLWAVLGGGLQVNLVNGRLETGYMQTVAPSSDSDIGNFFIRLVFTDF